MLFRGIGQAALVVAREYAQLRRQFGKKIEDITPVAEMLVQMTLALPFLRGGLAGNRSVVWVAGVLWAIIGLGAE